MLECFGPVALGRPDQPTTSHTGSSDPSSHVQLTQMQKDGVKRPSTVIDRRIRLPEYWEPLDVAGNSIVISSLGTTSSTTQVVAALVPEVGIASGRLSIVCRVSQIAAPLS